VTAAADALVPAAPVPRPLRWTLRAWSHFGWRDVTLAYALSFISQLIGPAGSYFFYPGPTNPANSMVDGVLSGHYLSMFLPMMFFARVADAAVEDHRSTLLSYVAAWLAGAILGPLLNQLISIVLDRHRSTPSFWMLTLLLQGGAGMWAYAYWRITQRAHRFVLAAEAERVRIDQQVHAARLLGLQARVDPDLLFDTLTCIGSTHERDEKTADRMLEELIFLLRSMLPGRSLTFSTVEREARLAEAWLRVAAHTSSRIPLLTQQVPPDAGDEPIPAMVIVPLLQCAMNAFETAHAEWAIAYAIEGQRLHVRLFPSDETHAVRRESFISFEPTHGQLIDALGPAARLRLTISPPRLEFDFPRSVVER
jgi:Histidine kinase